MCEALLSTLEARASEYTVDASAPGNATGSENKRPKSQLSLQLCLEAIEALLNCGNIIFNSQESKRKLLQLNVGFMVQTFVLENVNIHDHNVMAVAHKVMAIAK
jgi:hypothetical protein